MAITEQYSFAYLPGEKKFNGTIANVDIAYNACTGQNGNNNDLQDYYERLKANNEVTKDKFIDNFDAHVVGDENCPNAIDEFMWEHGWVRKGEASQAPSAAP